MKIYVSHAICGGDGPNASEETKQKNCEAAKKWANLLRMNLGHQATKGLGLFVGGADGLYLRSEDELYVPAEHEDFVGRAYTMGLLSIPEILRVDCEIVKSCDALVALGPISNGMKVEIECAEKHGIRVIYVDF